MSNKILEGMSLAYDNADHSSAEGDMKAALLWLADNVSEEMRDAFWREWDKKGDNQTVRSIAAALHAGTR